MKKISTRLIPTLSTVALFGFSAATLAAPIRLESEVVTQKVRFADLDLSTAEGARTLYGRIKGAARLVCRNEQSLKLELRCEARAIDNAVSEIGNPLLASVHGAATGRNVELVSR